MGNCDICSKKVEWLDTLNSEFKTNEIKKICQNCSSELRKKLQELEDLTRNLKHHWFKKFMNNYKLRKG